MPSCKAKFCTVKRGKCISCFAISDPTKNRALCERWIHNLGIKNLDIKHLHIQKRKSFVKDTLNRIVSKKTSRYVDNE